MVLLRLNKKKDDWEIITKEEKEKLPEEEQKDILYMDALLKEKLDFAIAQQKRNNDCPAIIGGDEGSGKSSIAGNIMRYVSKDKWDPQADMIGTDYDEGIEKIKNASHGGQIMFDEGNAFFLSTEIMKREARDLHKIFSIFRQKCLFVLIVLPSFFRLNSYFAMDRSKFLIRTYEKNGQRGYFCYYGQKRKSKLYRAGRKEHNYNIVRPNFRGRFTTCSLLESEDYRSFKLDTLNKSITIAQKKKAPTPQEIILKHNINIVRNNPDKTAKQLADLMKVTTRTIENYRQRIRIEDSENNEKSQNTNQLNSPKPESQT